MPKITENLVVNGSAGALVSVTPLIHARKMIIEEDPNNGASTGINYTLPDDGFVFVHSLDAGAQLILGDSVAHGNNAGFIIGKPAYNTGGVSIAADVVAKLISKTPAATKYRKTEIE